MGGIMHAVVTKASDDGSFQVGDHIQFEEDGTIICLEAGGWMEAENVEEATKGMKYETDTEWAKRELQRVEQNLTALRLALKGE